MEDMPDYGIMQPVAYQLSKAQASRRSNYSRGSESEKERENSDKFDTEAAKESIDADEFLKIVPVGQQYQQQLDELESRDDLSDEDSRSQIKIKGDEAMVITSVADQIEQDAETFIQLNNTFKRSSLQFNASRPQFDEPRVTPL